MRPIVEPTSAAIICRPGFLRDMMSENLVERGINLIASAPCFTELPSDCNPDVVVVIEDAAGDLFHLEDDIPALAQRFDRWLTVGPGGHGSAFAKLCEHRNDVSGVPLDIGKDDLFHAVILAARLETVRIGASLCGGSSRELCKLKGASLDIGQWQILKLLADGASNKHIANEFECEESQVKGMVRRLLIAINASNRTHAAVIAARAGL